MQYNYDYLIFLREKIIEYLPHNFINIGGKYKGRCPFCGDSKKSQTKARGYWYANTDCSYFCFNCGISMSGLKLLQTLSGRDYDDIKREYAKAFAKTGWRTESVFPNEDCSGVDLMHIKSMLDPSWKKPLSDDAKSYLAGRMIDKAPFLREDLFTYQGSKGEYILIPWVVNGVDAYYQLNDYKKLGSLKYVFPKNSHKLVYGLDNVDLSWPYVIVFEGVYDSLFVKNAVAVGTKSLSDRQERLIRERYPNHRICLSFDNDKPGLDSMAKAVEKNDDVLFFKWFDDDTSEKDINEKILSAKDAALFSSPKRLEKRILTPLQMKMWLIQERGYSFGHDKIAKAKPPKKKEGSLISRRALFE